MKSKLLAAAAIAASMPGLGFADVGHWRNPIRGEGTKLRNWSSRRRRNAQRLQMHGWVDIPCDAPDGYFWKRDAHGKMWRLYALPPGIGERHYDAHFDRTIIRSGWGYVNPTYAPGNQL